jgi:universal stress protein A
MKPKAGASPRRWTRSLRLPEKPMSKRSKTTPNVPPAASSIRLRHILVPFDFSEGAKLALQHAIAYARQFKGRVTLLHVVHLPFRGIGFGPGEDAGMEARLCRDMRRQVVALAARITRAGVPAAGLVQAGYPGLEISDLARRELFDLVIMGTHGRTGLKHVLLGSVAERVVRHAPCPVLVVREPDKEGSLKPSPEHL